MQEPKGELGTSKNTAQDAGESVCTRKENHES